MKHLLALVSCLVVAAGCKTDSSAPAGSSAAPTASSSDPSRPSRSGKIDLPQRRTPSGSAGEAPALPGQEDPDAWRARREDRRKDRQEMLDVNKDGTISPEEVAVARKARAEEMRTRLDADGDGKVTPAELGESRMARRLGDISDLDVDKNGDISTAEIEGSMEKQRARMRELRESGGGPDGERRGRRAWGTGSGSATE